MIFTNRPAREEDGARPSPVSGRHSTPRITPVTSPADIEARVERQLAQSRRRGGGLALLSISVDAVGLAGGPAGITLERAAWQEVSNRIGGSVRGSDTILRESERETVVLMPGADAAVAQRVRQRLEGLVGGGCLVAGRLLRVTVRVGMVAVPVLGLRAPELLRRAAGRD